MHNTLIKKCTKIYVWLSKIFWRWKCFPLTFLFFFCYLFSFSHSRKWKMFRSAKCDSRTPALFRRRMILFKLLSLVCARQLVKHHRARFSKPALYFPDIRTIATAERPANRPGQMTYRVDGRWQHSMVNDGRIEKLIRLLYLKHNR